MSPVFAFSDEQLEFRAMLRRFVSDRSPETAVREQMESERGWDPKLWKDMAEQLGLQGIAIPEAFGGQGFGFVELAIALEELGRALVCAPYFGTVVLAANALLLSDDEDAQVDLLPGIAAGTTVAALAVAESAGRWDEDGIQAAARRHGDGWQITGTKHYVIDGHSADVLIVAARSAGGVGLFRVDGDAPGLRRTPLATLDRTRKQAKVELVDTPARPIGAEGTGAGVLPALLDLAAVALAAEQVGGAQACLDMSVAYAKDRVQFGRPIGSFQAIKHKCADVLLEVESARSAAYYAAWSAAEQQDDLAAVAALARATCSDAYLQAASENIQIHGGIGFTWEHPAHLYLRRAKSSDLLFGDASHYRELLAQRIGL